MKRQKTGGRKEGVPNKATAEIRDAIQLIEKAVSNKKYLFSCCYLVSIW